MKPISLAIPVAAGRVRESDLALAAMIVGPCAALAALLRDRSELLWLALALCLVLAGWVVLRRLLSACPEAAMTWNMLLLGTFGMLAGLALDVRGPGLLLITSQCGTGAMPGFLPVLYLHWSGLPAMHIGMLSGGLVAAPLLRLTQPRAHPSLRVDVLRHAACSVWMLLGMTFGSVVCERLAMVLAAGPADGSAVLMLGGMFAGMAWGMVAHAAFGRAGKRLRKTSILFA